jgi:hypothetical protein
MGTKSVSAIFTLALLFGVLVEHTFAWGPDGHRMIAKEAVEGLPSDMPAFFISSLNQLMFLSFEPDVWRDSEEEKFSMALRLGADPDHHFHLELFHPPALPEDRYSYLDLLCRRGIDPQQAGMLPYRAMELFQRMRVDFRKWRAARAASDVVTAKFLEDRIIDDAGILAHYIGDASQPLHTTNNHNGWEAQENPNGFTRDNTIHLRFEDAFVKANVHEGDVKPLVRKCHLVESGLPYIYQEIQRSNDQVESLYELDKFQRFGPDDNDPRARAFAARRLADAASVLRDLWYTAYITSGVQSSR